MFNLKRYTVLLPFALFPFITAWETDTHNTIPDVEFSLEAVAWSDSVYNTLSLEEKIGQLFVAGIDAKDTEQNRILLKRLIKGCKVGGILFSKGDVVSQLKLTNTAQREAEIPLLITLDGEWGLAMRLKDAPRFPMNITIGAAGDDSLTYAYGREVGRECRRMGIHVNFAPDIDVNSNPNNPVIGRRSFGDNPEAVAKLGILYARGLSDEGIIPVAKHFPGHGDVDADSHKTLPINNKSREELEQEELLPFRKYIEAGMQGIMTGHLFVPALDNKSGLPSSLSPYVVDSLLKGELKFNKLIFTDALEMKGANSDNNALKAILAGNDILLKPADIEKDIHSLKSAFKRGELPEKRLRDAVKKILRYKYAIHNISNNKKETHNVVSDLNSPQAENIIYSLYAKAVTVLKNNKSIIPLHSLGKYNFRIECFGSGNTLPFTDRISSYIGNKKGGNNNQEIAIAAIYSDKSAYIQQVREFCSGKRYILIFFTSPYTIQKYRDDISKAEGVIIAYENCDMVQKCAAEILFGGLGASGKLPVNILPTFKRGTGFKTIPTRIGFAPPEATGMDRYKLAAIDTIAKEGIKESAYPGCQILVARHGKIIYNKSFGTLDKDEKHPVTDKSIYDVASVTKCAATTPLLMYLYSQGELNIDEPLSLYIPETNGSALSDISVKQALFHESGLPSGIKIPYIITDSTSYGGTLFSSHNNRHYKIKVGKKMFANKNACLKKDLFSDTLDSKYDLKIVEGLYASSTIKDTLFSEILKLTPSKTGKYVYSDINFILLQRVVEELTGCKLDQLADSLFYAPLGMTRTGYLPLSRFELCDIVPTEQDDFLRKQLLRGYVHDETAGFMGGISGNAGLFSTAEDLAKLLQMYLNGGVYGGERFLTEESVKLFTRTTSPNSRRALGFDKPDIKNPDKSPTSPQTPASAYGHTGYTGTAFWVDPENDLIYVFLSNRVYPHRWNTKFLELNIRPRIQTAIYNAIKQ